MSTDNTDTLLASLQTIVEKAIDTRFSQLTATLETSNRETEHRLDRLESLVLKLVEGASTGLTTPSWDECSVSGVSTPTTAQSDVDEEEEDLQTIADKPLGRDGEITELNEKFEKLSVDVKDELNTIRQNSDQKIEELKGMMEEQLTLMKQVDATITTQSVELERKQEEMEWSSRATESKVEQTLNKLDQVAHAIAAFHRCADTTARDNLDILRSHTSNGCDAVEWRVEEMVQRELGVVKKAIVGMSNRVDALQSQMLAQKKAEEENKKAAQTKVKALDIASLTSIKEMEARLNAKMDKHFSVPREFKLTSPIFSEIQTTVNKRLDTLTVAFNKQKETLREVGLYQCGMCQDLMDITHRLDIIFDGR